MQTGTNNPYAAPVSDVRNAELDEYGKVNILLIGGRLGRVRYIAFLMSLILIVWGGGMMLRGPVGRLMLPLGIDIALTVMMVMMAVIYGVALIGSFMLAIQRVHDFNTSGWITLLFLVPIINIIFGFVLWFVPGTDGENRFGRKLPPTSIGTKVIAALGALSFFAIFTMIAVIATTEFQKYQKQAQEAAQAK